MSQTLDRLVYMANQIAGAFQHQEPDQAVAATCDHLRRYWDPRMRRLIAEHRAGGGEGLGDIARRAVERLAIPAAEPQPSDFTPVPGETASDAG